jgi:hypothetical protein
MIPIILLVSVIGVGAVGLVISAVMLKRGYLKRRDMRVRAEARARLIEASRARAAGVVAAPINPVADLSGVIAKLEESVRFAKAPAEPIAPPTRAAKGSVAPPIRAAPIRAVPPMPPMPRVSPAPARGRSTVPPPIPQRARTTPSKPSRH